jgi:hypothetical protein
MSLVRVFNGNDILVKLSVQDTISALQVMAGTDGFVELPTEDGPIHVRPSAVIAVLEDASHKRAGFRVMPEG